MSAFQNIDFAVCGAFLLKENIIYFFVKNSPVKITVYITPKKTVLDPQGEAVGHAMVSLGYDPTNVRVGKTVTFDIEGEDSPEFRKSLDKLCDDLLSNPVIEDYRYEIN